MALAPDLVRLVAPVRARPTDAALLLDLDGTLAPIVERPEEVAILPAIRATLPALRRRVGLLAFISGRAESDLRRIVRMEGVAYSGNHGLELSLPDGRRADDPRGQTLAARLQAFAARWPPRVLSPRGIWLEDKQLTLTFHFRTAADPAAAAAFLEAEVAVPARGAGLLATPGRMSLEVRTSAEITKGTAARTLLEGWGGSRTALALGDDRTDVDVWRAIREMAGRGTLDAAIGVAVTSDETPREVRDEADGAVVGPDGVAELLTHLADQPAT